MRNFFLSKVFVLMTCFLGISCAQANDKIDRDTETAIPRIRNLYGVGVAVLPKTSGSDEFRLMALPIINANYADRFYINALQAGVWLLDSDDKRIRLGLAAQARFGWDAGDGRMTRGMRDRDFTVEIGPAIRWQTDFGTIIRADS
jgi:outer membrane protein